MKHSVLLLLSILIFSGCMYTKRTIDVECIDGKVYLSTWQANVTDTSQDIRKEENARFVKSLVVSEHNQTINCSYSEIK